MPTCKHAVTLYALSTCIHCKHTRQFLEDKDVPFDCVYVDKLEGENRTKIVNTIRSFNPRISFPTIVIDNGEQVIVGFKENELNRVLEL